MKAITLTIALLSIPLVSNAASVCGTNSPVTATKWQDFATVINQQTACIHELQASLLLSQRDIANIISAYDNKLRRELAIVCAYNAKVPDWLTALPGMEKLPTDDLVCPPAGSKFYKIQYISKDAPADITPTN